MIDIDQRDRCTERGRPTKEDRMIRSVGARRLAAVLVAAAVLAAVTAAPAGAAKAKKLVGTFTVTAGASDATTVTGSYFRMVEPDGTVADGPFVANGDSAAADKTYTLLAPGDDDGLVTGTYQSQPEPPFDATGNGTATAIVTPTMFFGVLFALATNETDPQTDEGTKRPVIKVKKGKLKGNLSALGVAYGNQHFNQGSPKPDGTRPGETAGPTGTYDRDTGEYTLEWSSAIVGGPFDGFTGMWHLEGTFRPRK
jgi:hypothetical protein